jgi:hypothetical protein
MATQRGLRRWGMGSVEGEQMSRGALIGEIVFRAFFPAFMLGLLFFGPIGTDWNLLLNIMSAWIMLVSFVAFIKTVRGRLPRLHNNERFVAFSVFYELGMIAAVAVIYYALLYKQLGLLEGEKPVTDPLDFLYFSIVTWTTLGYGDIRPAAAASKLFAASEALYGYSFMGLYIALVFYAISSRTGSKVSAPGC